MKYRHILAILVASLAAFGSTAGELFSYSTPDGRSGLRLALRDAVGEEWRPLGEKFNFVSSDFGPWGEGKKMFSPRLFVNAADSMWTCVWTATADGAVTAVAVSPDLRKWQPQRYFASPHDLPRDMRPLSPVTPDSTVIEGAMVRGYRQEISDDFARGLERFVAERNALCARHSQHAVDDGTRFAGLGPVTFSATAQPDKAYPITDKLIGIFFEDINYAADGGLYAELVQNRDFEYIPSDRKGDPEWRATHSWATAGAGTAAIDSVKPIHPNNPHYMSIDGEVTLTNAGYDGMSLKKGDRYLLDVALRTPRPLRVAVTLTAPDGRTVASSTIKAKGADGWQHCTATLRAKRSVSGASLNLMFPKATDADVDMVSLFPEKTFHGRRNGLRADLAQTLADLKPKFVRFPGGCVAHGNGIDNIYDWKGSVGPLEARKPLRNLWNYHQTRGLGYHEYFLFCEDLGAEPLPVLAAGVPCQNSSMVSHHSDHPLTALGQQCGIPMDEMDAYIRDVLDLIEYANGDVTTEWGARRAEAGHPEPFNLKYLGIGNEDLISEVFEPRFRMIYDSIRARHPEITVVGTVGPFYEGSDYDAGWRLAEKLEIPMVDEHYYVDPAWMIHNQDYYDGYRRGGTKVYLGEYAAHLPGRPSNVETALAEALYLTSVERNGDVVEMTSYAPLLAKEGHTQWRPDLIYFTNDSVKPTVDYHVQRLFGNNAGTRYIPAPLKVDSDNDDVTRRVGMSVTRDEATGEHIVKIVNLLPVEARGDIDLSPLGIKAGSVRATILTGHPADSKAIPAETTLTLPHVTLPPYSFAVMRVR